MKHGKKMTDSKNCGFTLIEMITVVALVMIFSIFLVALMQVTETARGIGNASVEVRNDAKLALEKIMRELRETSLSSPLGASGIARSNGNSRISFPVPNVIGNSSISSWDTVVFELDSGAHQISRTKNSSTNVIGRNVQSLTFDRPDIGNDGSLSNDNIIKTSIITSKTTANGRTITGSLTSEITMRN